MAPMDRDVDDLLGELEGLLEEETVALRKLDQAAIDRIAGAKLALCDRLTADARGSGADVLRLQRIRKLSLYNQVLLVHARDSVRGVLALLTGDASNGHRSSGGDAHRLSVRV